jgi:hypothetical protein
MLLGIPFRFKIKQIYVYSIMFYTITSHIHISMKMNMCSYDYYRAHNKFPDQLMLVFNKIDTFITFV